MLGLSLEEKGGKGFEKYTETAFSITTEHLRSDSGRPAGEEDKTEATEEKKIPKEEKTKPEEEKTKPEEDTKEEEPEVKKLTLETLCQKLKDKICT